MEKVKLKTNILKREIINIFKKFGLSNNHATISANALINAELVGAYGHGLSRLKMYCDRIKKKVINPKPKIKIKARISKKHLPRESWYVWLACQKTVVLGSLICIQVPARRRLFGHMRRHKVTAWPATKDGIVVTFDEATAN